MASLRVFLDAINHKRKNILQPGEYVVAHDCIVTKVVDQIKLQVQFAHAHHKEKATDSELYGVLNCLCDAETGIAVAYDYVDIKEDMKQKFIKEYDSSTGNQFSSSLLRMSKSLFNTKRTVLASNAFSTVESASLLADNGLFMVGKIDSLKQRIPVQQLIRWHGQSTDGHVVLRSSINGKANAANNDVYAISWKRNEIPVDVEDAASEFNFSASEEVEHYIFNRGSSNEGTLRKEFNGLYATAAKQNKRPLVVQKFDEGSQHNGDELYSHFNTVPETFVAPKNWWHGPFHALIIRLCMDAYYAYEFQLGSAVTSAESYYKFTSKLVRQLVGPPTNNAGGMPIMAASSSSSNPTGASALAAAASLVSYVGTSSASTTMNADPDLHVSFITVEVVS